MRIMNDEQAVKPPTQEEVYKAISELKNGKAAGKNGIPAELLKAGSERLLVFDRGVPRRIKCSPSSILDKFQEYNLQTHHPFVDFKAAYDSVKRNELWQIMLEHGFPTKLIKLSRLILEGSKSCVRRADETSAAFAMLDGLKQGDELSNSLFNIALEGAVRRANVQGNGRVITKSHMLLGFADDIDIIGIDRRAMEEAF
ncbi:uncharacterized protein LOC129773088 [Toxorhynchites rutilus septentrionalis]|uniref:uncharacterized protein LOC129773088 n=1 Tax=Toxorhynchites rutilus septentrionalis TaxID=329112 RepID=UPI00247A29D9|nr:uncharacterized protein LOC129773088 [Toxorhynchites rutilus septentrionalis]